MQPTDWERRLEACTGFQWDAGNHDKNLVRHGVTNSECEQVFFGQPLLVLPDPQHSVGEARYWALGRTEAGRLLFVAFTFRDESIRVVSARDMSRRERRSYEQASANP